MTRAKVTLPELNAPRALFIEVVRRDTPGTDLPRYVAVLDAFIAWSAARADQVLFDSSGRRPGMIRFERAGTTVPLWTATATRGGAPTLEIHLASSGTSSTEQRAEAMRTLNAHSRVMLATGDRLRIGFGALKNTAALAAVLALLGRLLVDASPTADAPA